MEKNVTLKELAQELKIDRSALRKYVISKGFDLFKVRTLQSKGQQTLAVSQEDAERIRDIRRQEGYLQLNKKVSENGGYFYIIQLIPELDPLRVKLGITNNIEARLSAHRTASPTAELLKYWPCKQSWEPSAIASITRTGCKSLSNEVYICDSIANIINRASQFFEIMPK
jgi:hypothetical protein